MFLVPGPLLQALWSWPGLLNCRGLLKFSPITPPQKNSTPFPSHFFQFPWLIFRLLRRAKSLRNFLSGEGRNHCGIFVCQGAKALPRNHPGISSGIFPGIFFCIVLACLGTKKNSGKNSGGNSGRSSGPPAGEKFRSGFPPQQTKNSGVVSPPSAAAQFCKQNLGQI